jgi:alanine dehydrogenase
MAKQMLTLSNDNVKSLLTVKDAIEAVEQSFREVASGRVKMNRSLIDITQHDGTYLSMASYLQGANKLGIKIVTAYKNNPSRFNLPTVMATVLLFRPETGEPVSIMDGAHITSMRTGAASALATKHLAREDSHSVGIIGTGIQGRTHLTSICQVRKVTECTAYDIDTASCQRFVSEMTQQLGIPITASKNAEEVVTRSDIIVTATTSSTPVVKGEWLREGTHINSIMSISPAMRELDDRAIKSSKIVVDDIETALKESGDLVMPIASGLISREDIYAELGDIVIGRKKGRTNEKEITLFKSVGLPSHDVCVASKVYEKAVAGGFSGKAS